MPDIMTIAACSTVLAGIMCIGMLLSWFKDGRPARLSWLFAPFGIAVPGGILLTWPDILPGPWGLRLGWYFLTMTYGASWMAARVLGGRRPMPLAIVIPCTAVLIFSATLGADGVMPHLRMLPRILLFAAFNGLAAREFSRMRRPHLPSATTLYWTFATFFVFDLARSPFALSLPSPFGPLPAEVWSIALFNFMIVLEGALMAMFFTALGREQLAERHYLLASIDPLTGIGNRRALEDRLRMLQDGHIRNETTAVAVIDIDNFKAINDQMGHAFGDLVITETARIAAKVLGADNVFRVGGEEFAAVIAAATEGECIARAEALRTRFAAFRHGAGSEARSCTLSIGLASMDRANDHDSAFKAADRALYMAKRLGRNQTIMIDADAPLNRPENSAGTKDTVAL